MSTPSPSVPPSLVTDRLLLRPWEVSEAAVQRRLWEERDPRVPSARRIDADGRPTLEDLEERIRQGGPAHGLGLLAVQRRVEGEVIGTCGLVHGGPGSAALADEPPGPEIAFELLRSAQGQGLATEAAQAVVAWARGSGIEHLHATVWEWNAPSRRVLQKLGFTVVRQVASPRGHGDILVTTLAL